MSDITMPRLSDSMEEGTIVAWLKHEGDHVSKGEDLVEIETDKATASYQSPEDGVLAIAAPVGTTLPVGAVIARVGRELFAASSGDQQDGEEIEQTEPLDTAVHAEPATRTSGDGRTAAEVKATPLARRIAHLHGIDLATVQATGAGGRVVRADVELIAQAQPQATLAPPPPAEARPGPPPAAQATPTLSPPAGRNDRAEVIELTRLQRTVARRMSEAKATIPDFQLEIEVAMDAAIALRAELQELDAAIAPSLNDLIVKAAAIALRSHPRVNGSYRDGRFELHRRVNVGIAVAAEDALVVPVIRDVDSRSLGSIAAEARRLIERVRTDEISPPELSGATFTVSNLGMYGITSIGPIINPPQAAILGVGTVRSAPAVLDGELAERKLATLTLTCDHRILYGADAAEFLAEVKALLEQPARLAL